MGATHRNLRLLLLAIVLLLVPIGYWLRFRAPIPPEWRDRTGGALYVLFWSLLLAAAKPRLSAVRSCLSVLLVTCLLEFLQLWHPAWLEAIRATFPGRVLLGTTFDWSDFPNYFAGAFLAWCLLRLVNFRQGARIQ